MSFPRTGVCSVLVQGVVLPDQILRDILSVTLTYREGKAADGNMTLSDPHFVYFDSKIFSKNVELLFIMGTVEDVAPKGPFVIKSFSVDASQSGAPTLSLEFQDLTHRLHKKKEKKRHTGPCVDVITRVAEEAGYGFRGSRPKGVEFDEEKALVQANKTKASMINSLAERYGFVWGMDGKTMYFRRPNSLDELGEQEFVPVLSYRINDFSILDYRADFKYSREKIKQGSKVVTENIDFEKCETDGAFLSETLGVLQPELVQALGFDLPEDFELDEDVARGKGKLTTTESLQIAEINHALHSDDGTKALGVLNAIKEEPGSPIAAAARFLGLSSSSASSPLEKPGSLESVSKAIKGVKSIVNRDGLTGNYTEVGEVISNIQEALSSVSKDIDAIDDLENTEHGLHDFGGEASASSVSEAKQKSLADLYRSVVVCDAEITPTISSPRFKPSMGIILCGLGERLTGKYRITSVVYSYNSDEVFTSRISCQKRYYGVTDKDKRRVAQATEAIANGDTKQSTPGGSDKEVSKNDPVMRVDRDSKTGAYTYVTETVITGDS